MSSHNILTNLLRSNINYEYNSYTVIINKINSKKFNK